jgi:hypothetical protein
MAHFDQSWCARINAHKAAEPAAPPPEPAPFRKIEVPTQHFCDICGVEMYDHNCKIVCPNCGYKRDCTDP